MVRNPEGGCSLLGVSIGKKLEDAATSSCSPCSSSSEVKLLEVRPLQDGSMLSRVTHCFQMGKHQPDV